jgi:hypothetical protein
MSWNWNIFTVTNIFEHAEFKSEKLPLRGILIYQLNSLYKLIDYKLVNNMLAIML